MRNIGEKETRRASMPRLNGCSACMRQLQHRLVACIRLIETSRAVTWTFMTAVPGIVLISISFIEFSSFKLFFSCFRNSVHHTNPRETFQISISIYLHDFRPSCEHPRRSCQEWYSFQHLALNFHQPTFFLVSEVVPKPRSNFSKLNIHLSFYLHTFRPSSEKQRQRSWEESYLFQHPLSIFHEPIFFVSDIPPTTPKPNSIFAKLDVHSCSYFKAFQRADES